ncbi:MAG: hypothetical protein EA360_11415 [Balneolaceae bacterium]|nr:MAG: hypothetical protein EA360_11415 [Balneolaceae bacterium]
MNNSKETLDVPAAAVAEIEKAIASDQSVVGIDAKKTHIIIIHMLREIREQLDRTEKRLDRLEQQNR